MAKPAKEDNKFKIICLAAFLLLVGIIALVGFFISQGDETAKLTALKKEACEKENPTIADVSLCAAAACTFNPAICDQMCPFDYASDKHGCPVSCECADEGVYQGDIRFDPSEINDMAKMYGYTNSENDFEIFFGSASSNAEHWKDYYHNGRYKIAYEVAKNVRETAATMGALKGAIASISKQTCIDFVERTNEDVYFEIKTDPDNPSCSSYVGKRQGQKQPVTLAPYGCSRVRTVMHEFTHLLGFKHEHVRPDRDAFITILKENILPDRFHNFRRLDKSEAISFGIPLDFKSVMMYDSNSFLVSSDVIGAFVVRETGKPSRADYSIKKYSDMDAIEINMAYDCLKPNRHDAGWTSWDRWTPCDETCGNGEQYRYRKCQDSAGEYAVGCEGEAMESQKCTEKACPFKDHWLEWSSWSECAGPCGQGKLAKTRECTAPGKCGSFNVLSINCDPCSSSGKFTLSPVKPVKQKEFWAPWSFCSSSCNGKRSRKKICTAQCQGDSNEIEDCNTDRCIEVVTEKPWGSWTSCTASCDGERIRREKCNGDGCLNAKIEKESCNVGACSVTTRPWGSWTSCTASCDGERIRRQQCSGNECYNAEVEREPCNVGACASTTSFENGWGEWSTCSASCDGVRKRKKQCPGVACPEEQERCNVGLCISTPSGSTPNSKKDGLFDNRETRIAGVLCNGGQQLLGDFDGDGKTDSLCVDPSGSMVLGRIDRMGRLDKVVMDKKTTCGNAEKYIADFNGDGMDDMLCRNSKTKSLTVKLFASGGRFSDSEILGGNFCTESSDKLILIDMDRNKKMDLLCHHKDGRVEIRMNSMG